MKNCDLCGDVRAESELIALSSNVIRSAIANGFNPFKEINKLANSPGVLHARASGASDVDIFYNWKTQAMADTSNWFICSECKPILQGSLNTEDASINEQEKKKKTCRNCGKEVPVEITVCPCGSHAFVEVEKKFINKATESLKEEAGGYYARGNKEYAVVKFKEALLIDPTDASIWSNIGAVLMEINEAEEAVKFLNQALQIDPNLGPPKRMLEQIKSHGIATDSSVYISIEEVKQQVEDAKKRSQEIARRGKLQLERKANGKCRYCGDSLSFIQRLKGKDHHAQCNKFIE